MFYKQSDVEESLKCPECQQRLNYPRLFPCGESFCQTCVENLIKNAENNEIKCSACDSTHEIPEEKEFPANKALEKILGKVCYEIYRSEMVEEFKQTLNQIKQESLELKSKLKSSESILEDHYLSSLREIEIARERTVQMIDKSKNELLEKINQEEESCLKNLKSNLKFSQTGMEMRLFCTHWNNYLKFNNTEESLVSDAIDMVKENQENMDYALKLIDTFQFNGRTLEFQMAKMDLNSIMGSLERKTLLPNFQLNKVCIKIITRNGFSKQSMRPFRLSQERMLIIHKGKFKGLYMIEFNLSNGKIVKQEKLTEQDGQYEFVKNKNLIFAYLIDENESQLRVYDLSLRLKKKIFIESFILQMTVNDSQLICLTDSEKLLFYDHELNLTKTSQLKTKEFSEAFYIPESVESMKCDNQNLYFYSGGFIRVACLENGSRISKFEIDSSDFFLSNKSSVIIYKKDTCDIVCYDLNGSIIAKRNLSQLNNLSEIVMFEYDNNNISLVDCPNSFLLYNDIFFQ